MNSALTAAAAERASRSCSAGGSPRRADSARAALAARRAWRSDGRPALRVLVDDPVDRGVDERRRAEHHLGRVELGDPAADGRQAAEAALGVRHVARQAALQPQHAAEVVGQHRVRQLALHEHDHRLVAEVLLEALGGLEALRAAARRACRWRRSARAAARARRPPRASTAVTASTSSGRRVTAATIRAKACPLTGVRLGDARADHYGSGCRRGKVPLCPTSWPSGVWGSHGGAALRLVVPPNVK